MNIVFALIARIKDSLGFYVELIIDVKTLETIRPTNMFSIINK